MTARRTVYNDARRARTAAENHERKQHAVRQLQEWAGDNAVRLSLLAQYCPKGVAAYPASDLLSCYGRLRAKEHYVLIDGIAMPPPDETPTKTLWRQLWGDDR